MFDINTDEFYMDIALKEANIAYNNGDVPIGCVVIYNKNENYINLDKINKNAPMEMLKKIEAIDNKSDIVILSKAYNRRYIDKDATDMQR